MDEELREGLAGLTTASLADAVMRLGLELRVAPHGLRPATPGMRTVGEVLPARHHGSVDVFFEAIEGSGGGEVLVADNGGRAEDACIGDLVVIEAREAGLAGIVVWGLHRDHDEVTRLGLPVFSYGKIPLGPQEATPRRGEDLASARVGTDEVTREDFVLADDDGAVFAPIDRAADLLEMGTSIIRVEREQAERALAGSSLREQMRFREYLAARDRDPSYTFRQHLRGIRAEIEE